MLILRTCCNFYLFGNYKFMDNISYLIVVRALFIYLLIEKGWAIKKCKHNSFEMFKHVKKPKVI